MGYNGSALPEEEVVIGAKFQTEVEYLGRSTAELFCVNHPDELHIPVFKIDDDKHWCLFCAAGFKSIHKLVSMVQKEEGE